MGQSIASEMNPATPPGGRQDAGHGRRDPIVCVRDDQLDAGRDGAGRDRERRDLLQVALEIWRLWVLSGERQRFGYRCLHILLRREGWALNWKNLSRIYREEDLTVRKRGGRKRALGTRTPMAMPQGPNQRGSLDFVSDNLSDGRRFRIPCVIDDFSRECLATVADTSLCGHRVARELDRIAEVRGHPCMVVRDNGTELTSNTILKLQEDRRVEWHHIASRCPSAVCLQTARAEKTDAQRPCRELQQPPSGRVLQRASDLQPAPGQGAACGMAH